MDDNDDENADLSECDFGDVSHRMRIGQVLVPLFKMKITPVHHHQDNEVAQGHAHMIEETIESGLMNGPGHQTQTGSPGHVPGVIPESETRKALMKVQGGLAPDVESIDH